MTSIEKHQLDLIFQNNTSSFVGNLAVGGLLTVGLFGQIDTLILVIWFLTLFSLSTMRLAIGSHYLKSPDLDESKILTLRKNFAALVLMSALVWHVGAWIFYDYFSTTTTSFLLVMFAGLAAGSAGTLSPIKWLANSFVFIILVPLILQGFWFAETQIDFAIAIVTLVYLIFSIKINGLFSDSILKEVELNANNTKLIEELEEAKFAAESSNKVKSEFITNISPETRTPLNAIMGFTQLLISSEDDVKKLEYLKNIDRGSKQLLDLLNDILDLSRLERGKVDIFTQETELKVVLNSVITKFQSQLLDKEIALNYEISNTTPKLLEMDPIRWGQVLKQILSNAIKFSHKNSNIDLLINYEPNSSTLSCTVCDNGIGVKEEDMDHIFSNFTQKDSSTTRRFGGVGMGLPLARHLTRLMKGEISVKSKEGQGSCFTFTIHAPSLTKEDTQKPVTKLLQQSFAGKVLIVEDNITNQLLMKSLLVKLGLDYEIASDGIQGVIAFDTARDFDLILMDENMPNLNGIAATERIRQIEQSAELKHTPIVAVTANAQAGDRERFLASGMDDYLAKPVSLAELETVLDKYLEQRA